MRLTTIMWLLCVILVASTATGQNWGGDPPEGAAGISVADEVAPAPVASDSFKASAAKLQRRPGFTWKKRRELGLTIPNMIRKLAEMDAAGELDELDQSEVSVVMLQRLNADNPKAFAAEAAIDQAFWERFLKFIQFILPLLLMFI